jgi:FtsP/CotA-like multicopper oxidase with cupredoxin domain
VSRSQRLTFLGIAAAIAIAAVIVLAAAGGDDDGGERSAATATPSATDQAQAPEETTTSEPTSTPTPRPKPPLLTAGGDETVRATEGERVRFRVRSDAADEVHVHGYDISFDVPASKTVTISFDASITGIFEMELELSKQPLGKLRVDPK